MNRAIADRLTCLASILSRAREVQHLTVFDGLISALKWYGLHRLLYSRRLSVTPIDSRLDWIDLGAFGIAWPSNHPRARFIGALIELRAPSNSHFYFDDMTTVKGGDIVVDVGASEGTFAVECLVKYKAAHVWCFEPESSMQAALSVTAERNSLSSMLHVVPAAAAAMSGSVRIVEDPADPLASYCIGDGAGIGQREGVGFLRSVDGVSLDDWANSARIERLDYLKIDAEGSDLEVLRGARKCLERWRPVVAVTTYHHPNHCNEMVEYLSSLSLGYQFRAKGVITFDSVARPVMLHATTTPARSISKR
jgi:FkbM family methyltransferase